MMKKGLIAVIVLILVLNGCGGLIYSENIAGPYFAIATDDINGLSIGYRELVTD